MISNRKSTALVFAALFAFALPQFMSAAPAEAGRGYSMYWKQKRAKQATEKRLQDKHTKVHSKKKTDPATQALRQRLFAGAPLSPQQLKFLADKGEGLAAVRYAQAMQQRGGAQGITVTYFAKAAALGRKDAVKPFLALLRTPGASLSADDLRAAEASLLALTKGGNVDAMTGLAQFYLTGAPFGANDKKALELLVMAGRRGDGEAAVQAGLLLEASSLASGSRAEALKMYEIAASQGNLIALSKVQSLASVE